MDTSRKELERSQSQSKQEQAQQQSPSRGLALPPLPSSSHSAQANSNPTPTLLDTGTAQFESDPAPSDSQGPGFSTAASPSSPSSSSPACDPINTQLKPATSPSARSAALSYHTAATAPTPRPNSPASTSTPPVSPPISSVSTVRPLPASSMHPSPPPPISTASSWAWRLLDRAGDLATRVLGDEHDHVLRPRSDLLASETVPDDQHRDVAVAVAPGGEPAITVAQQYIVQGNNAPPSPTVPAQGQGQHTGVAAFADYDGPVVVVNRLALVGNALGIFAPGNPIRQAAVRIVASRHWKLVMVTLTALHWLLLALRPWSKGEANEFTLLSVPLELALLPIFAIYNLEIILKLIAYGALFLPPAFRKKSLFVDTDEAEVIDDSRRVDDDADDSERADEALETVAKAMHIEPYGKEEVVSLERLNEKDEDVDEEAAESKSVKDALQVANDVIRARSRSRSPARSPGLLHVPLTDADVMGGHPHSPAHSHSHTHARRDSNASATSSASSASTPTLDPYLIPKPFLHTTANQYDLVAVLAFWLYVILGLSSILTPLWILRGLTASRPFRLLGLTRGTRMIMASFRASRRLLRNVAVFTGFFFLLLVIAGVFSFKGAFQRQCMVLSEDAKSVASPVTVRHCGGWVTKDGWNALPMDPWAQGETLPNATQAERVTGYQCPFPQICMTSQTNPWFNFASFDHLPSAALVQYSVMTGENWGPILHGAMDAESPAAAFYFVLTVIVLGFLVLQLFIAVMCESFSSVRGAYLDAKAIAREEKKRRKREERARERAERESMLSRQTGMSPAMRRAVDIASKVQDSIVWKAAFFVCLAVYTWIVSQVASMETAATREVELNKWFWVEVVFTLVFAVEWGLRVVTTGWKKTLKEHPSDSVMTAVTLVLLVVPFNKYMTAFQVFRTYKLVTYIPPVKELVVATKGVTDMVSVVLFMTLAMAAAATYGMQMFGGVYESPSNNWVTFNNFGSAWLTMFAGMLIGDNWTEYLWACMKAHSDSLPVLGPIVGAAYVVIVYSALNFIVLNLLIVVVLDVFDEDDEEKRAKQVELVEKWAKEEEEGGRGPGKQQVVDKWWGRLQSWASTKSKGALDRLAQDAENDSTPPASREGTMRRRANRSDTAAGADNTADSNGDLGTMAASRSWNNDDRPLLGTVESQSQRIMQSQTSVKTESSASELYLRRQEPKFTSLAEVVAAPKAVKDSPSFSLTQLMPRRIDGLSADFEQDDEATSDKRKKRKAEQGHQSKSTLRRLVESRWFTLGIFLTVLFSIVTALLDTPVYRLQRLRELGGVSKGTNFADPFVIFDLVACVIFGFEFLCKIGAYRLDFFRDGWNLLDLLVLLTMVFSYAADEATASVMRMSRALRPLKTIVYLPGVQSVFAALVVGLPRIVSAVAFSMLILFPYSLYGMFLFSGDLKRCNDTSVNSLEECTGVYLTEQGLLLPRVWDNGYRAYNFDSIGNALTMLFTMASSEGWTDMMKLTMAIRGEDLQPAPTPAEAPTLSWWHCLYSVSFMFVASVFTLNLFIGIVIRSFDETSGDAFLTPAQKAWNTACKRIAGLRPRALYRPAKRRSALADLVNRFLESYGKPFNLFVTATMVMHVALMCVEHAGQPLSFTRGRDIAFQVFVVLFFVQTMLLMTSKGPIYFFRKSIWNLYEFLVNSLGFIFVIVQLFVDDDTFTQLQKLLLVAYALRLARRVNGLHTLFKTMRASASDLLRVFFVLAIILLFFSLVGTELFGLTRFGNAFVDNGSVRNTWISLLLQFRLLTGDDWPNIMQDLLVDGPLCVKGNGYLQSDCGSPIAAYIFFVSFFIVCTYVLLNLIIALLVNNFDYCFSTNHTIISDDGLRSFQLAWSTLDPRGTGKIRRAQITTLLARSTLQKVDYQLAQDRRWRSNILFYDLLAQCKDGHLNFQTALMTLCLHVIPLQECLTYDQYKYRVEYLRRLSQHIARERLEGLFLMAVARRRFMRRFRQVVQEAIQQSRLNVNSVASNSSAASSSTPPN
ncbi:Ion transport protein-domain-containing protein, partial [Catenaria anguillulae PL171]